MRAVSTVVDVTVFLLLVSAALVALASPPPSNGVGSAAETATALGRTTTNVTYRFDPIHDARARRAAGTHAGLLGRAALANLQLDGRTLAPGSRTFGAAVRAETGRTLDWAAERTSVTASWRPYAGAPLVGRMHVGVRPPTGADVATATLRVPVPVGACESAAGDAAGDGYDAVAAVIAECVLDATLHPTAVTADPASGTRRVADRRADAYAKALSVDRGDADDRRRHIASALAGRLAADMRARFPSPAAAADAVSTGTARVVVREWPS